MLFNVPQVIPNLLARVANVNAVDNKGCRPLCELAGMEGLYTIKVFNKLRGGGANIDLKDDLGYTAQHLAIRNGNKALVECMWGGTIASSVDSNREVCALHGTTNRKDSCIELAALMCGLFPEDILYQNMLGEAYFAEGRYSEALEQFKATVYRDNHNTRDENLLLHRTCCVGCNSRIRGRWWKCLDKACSKFDWCMHCVRVQGSVGGLCSHDRVMGIPSSKVKSLCRIFEPWQQGE